MYTNLINSEKHAPVDLLNKTTVVVQGGKFLVTKDLEIYRVNSRGINKCPQHKSSRKGRYLIVTGSWEGKQQHFYVHRLIAEAFLPNVENKPHINHKDGNPSNNSINNLEWVTPSENVTHAYSLGLIDPYTNGQACKYCKDMTRRDDGICTRCSHEKNLESERVINVYKIWETLRDVDLGALNNRDREIIKLRMQGVTYQNIGDIFGITRQRVEQIINRSLTIKNDISKKYSRNILESHRKIHRLTIIDVGELLGISGASYRRKEKGKSEFTISEAYKLSELFGLSLDEIFYDNGEIRPLGRVI